MSVQWPQQREYLVKSEAVAHVKYLRVRCTTTGSPMQGLMMDYPLTLTHVVERSARLFPANEIASRMPGGMHRYTYADFYKRVHQLASVLHTLGVERGDRVGTLCWNSYRHLELYFGVT